MNVSQAIIISSLITLFLSFLILAFPIESAILLGASETLLPLVVDYLQWIMPCYVFEMWSMIGLFVIRLDGSPRYAMWCNIIPAMLNIILDWILIFPLGMGVKGAAIATTISIMVGGIMALVYLFFFANSLGIVPLKMSSKSLMLSFRNICYQCKVGLSTLFGELTLAVLVFVGNIVFMEILGDAGVGAFGIACYYTPFFFMVGNAVAQSAQPIISYNYGISRWKEIEETRKLLLVTSTVIGLIVTMLFMVVPDKLVALFVDKSSEAGQIAIDGFPYFAIGIVFFILNVAFIGYYQSVERIKRATFLVFLRGLILLVPSFLLLPRLLGVEGIWMAMPMAEIMTTIILLLFFGRYSKRS